jgi:hypothetical protein
VAKSLDTGEIEGRTLRAAYQKRSSLITVGTSHGFALSFLAASDLHYALLGGLPSAYRSQEATAKHTTANCHRIFGGNLR